MSRLKSLSVALENAGFVILDTLATDEGLELAIGSAGQPFWNAVAASPEWTAVPDHPVDAFTRRAITDVLAAEGAAGTDAAAHVTFVFDADAPNFVVLWTQRFPMIAQSDLGLMIHPEYGLWMAARAHILLPGYREISADSDSPKGLKQQPHFDPCASCSGKPCLAACPVGAFSAPKTFEYQACAAHLLSNPACFSAGCDARAACPYGQSWQLPPDQAHYHQSRVRRAVGPET